MSEDRKSGLIAGAVIGVLGTLTVLVTLLTSIEGHFVTRREYDVVLQQINGRLARIESKVDAGAPGAVHPNP